MKEILLRHISIIQNCTFFHKYEHAKTVFSECHSWKAKHTDIYFKSFENEFNEIFFFWLGVQKKRRKKKKTETKIMQRKTEKDMKPWGFLVVNYKLQSKYLYCSFNMLWRSPKSGPISVQLSHCPKACNPKWDEEGDRSLWTCSWTSSREKYGYYKEK